MIDHLILCLKQHKSKMDYKNIDFNSDVVAMYSKLRESMALAFEEECFGPVDMAVQEGRPKGTDELKGEEKAFQAEVTLAKSPMKRGYNRIKFHVR